jgi:hypothetical protein
MRRSARPLAVLGAALLAGCGALDPYPTLATAPEPGQPVGQRVGICYNRLAASLAEVRKEAQLQCPAHTRATPVYTDWYLMTCPLLLPARASFVCTAPK